MNKTLNRKGVLSTIRRREVLAFGSAWLNHCAKCKKPVEPHTIFILDEMSEQGQSRDRAGKEAAAILQGEAGEEQSSS